MQTVKDVLFLGFCLLAGVIAGGLLAQVCAGIPGLSWLAYSKSLHIAPQLDLSVLRMNLDLVLELSAAQVLTLALAVFVYRRVEIL